MIHRGRALHPLDTTTVDDIPIATVPRILLDLAPRTAPQQLTRICHEAWVHHRVGPREVEACIVRNPTKKGAARLRQASGSDVTLSALESGFLALLRAHDLPLPRTNIDRRGDKVDCHWPDLELTIELLSYRLPCHPRGVRERRRPPPPLRAHRLHLRRCVPAPPGHDRRDPEPAPRACRSRLSRA